MEPLQVWLVTLLEQDNPVTSFMRTMWAWPMMESLHFIGLSLLVGAIAVFDLRLLGVGPRIPVGAAQALVPCALAGFTVSVLTGATFLLTEPNQYIYNPAFLLKMVFLAIAGLNAAAFSLSTFGRRVVQSAGPTPPAARVIAIVSLSLWIAIIVCGRLITFYRPGRCPEGERLIALCVP